MIYNYFKRHDSIISQLLFLLTVLSCNTCPWSQSSGVKEQFDSGEILVLKANILV
jgi:hypothetical protein